MYDNNTSYLLLFLLRIYLINEIYGKDHSLKFLNYFQNKNKILNKKREKGKISIVGNNFSRLPK